MKKVSQKQLTEHIDLVKWQEKKKLQKFNMLTIHSLLLNSNPKFMQLKQIIQIFNSNIDKGIQRKHLQYEYTQKIYEMLRHMILIPNYQNQHQFLNKVYNWSKQGGRAQIQFDEFSIGQSKQRPTTASTRTRALSAYSRPKSGVPKMPLRKLMEQPEMRIANRQNKKIDYDKLQPGDIQFYTGIRTLHQKEHDPRKKLKQYQRKIFYDEDPDSDIEIVDLDKNKKQINFYQPQIQTIDQPQPEININENNNILEGEQNANQAEMGQDLQEDINIDDLDIQGQIKQEQPQQVIDKLRPKRKVFVQHATELSTNKINYSGGINKILEDKNKIVKKNIQDKLMADQMNQWAKDKSRIKRQQRRRAQSARIVTKQVGIKYNQPKKLQENVNVINFQNIPIFQTKISRPKTAFKAFNPTVRKQIIKNCFITSKMDNHIQKHSRAQAPQSEQRFVRISSVAEKPKKKTFQQILKQAELKIKGEQMLQIQHVKQRFSKNKVQFQANRIAKSVTYHGLDEDQQQDYQDQFVGQITGISMLNNPFFKAGKKKKKKKKKK